MARARIMTSVTGGTFAQRTRIRWAFMRLRFNFRNLSAHELRTFIDLLITEAESRGLEVRVQGTVR